MVSPRAAGLAMLILGMALTTANVRARDEPSKTEADPGRPVASALGKGKYPWYDSTNDRVRPVDLPGVRGASPTLAGLIGSIFSLFILVGALAILIALLVWFWKIYSPFDTAETPGTPRPRGEPSRIEALPEGMLGGDVSADPWLEAIRRRDRGDLAGAVICLFAHQLLTLSSLGLVRLAPGRTGRQLHRSVADAEFRGLVQPTLRLFEAVYYGHRTPTAEEFARLWSQAEAFERRVAQGVAA